MVERQTAEIMYRRRCAGDTFEAIAKDNDLSKQGVHLRVKLYEERTGAAPSSDAARSVRTQPRKNAQRDADMARAARETRDARIVELDYQGKTQVEIAELLGVNRGIVTHVLLRERGRVKHKSPNVDEYTLSIWRGLVEAGATQEQIAKQTGYTQMAVSQGLRRMWLRERGALADQAS